MGRRRGNHGVLDELRKISSIELLMLPPTALMSCCAAWGGFTPDLKCAWMKLPHAVQFAVLIMVSACGTPLICVSPLVVAVNLQPLHADRTSLFSFSMSVPEPPQKVSAPGYLYRVPIPKLLRLFRYTS